MMEFLSPFTARSPAAEAEPAVASPSAADRNGAFRWPVIAVPVCYVLASVIVTWHLWSDPASLAVAGNHSDADLFAWYMRYAATAVGHFRLPALVSSAMNAPQGVNMMWNTSLLLPAVVLAPVTTLFGPQVSLTLLTTVGFAGSAMALYWVLRTWQVSTRAAVLAGAVYGFSPALVQSAVGHYNLQLAILPPLIVDAGLRIAVGLPPGARQPGRWLSRVPGPVRGGVRLGVLLAAEVFISEEVALLSALAGVVLVGCLCVMQPRAALRRAWPAIAGLLVGAAVTLGLAGHALHTQFAGRLVQHGALVPLDFYVNDTGNFVNPSTAMLFHTAGTAAAAARYQGGLTEYLGYLGWPLIIALVAAAVVCWRRPAGRAITVALAILVVLSLGGRLTIAGQPVMAVYLPWHWLEEHQLFSSVLPDRLSIVADGFAAALLALGIDEGSKRLTARRAASGTRPASGTRTASGTRPASGRHRGRTLTGPGLVLGAAVLACLPLLPAPLPAAAATPLPAGWTRAFAELRLRPGANVLVVPVPTNILTLAMRWQADTGEPGSMAGGYFIGPGAGGQAYFGGFGPRLTATYLNRLWASALPPGGALASVAYAAGLSTGSPAGPVSAGTPPAPAQVRADFEFWRPAAIVAVTPLGSPLSNYLVSLFGPPSIHSRAVLAWRL